MIDHASGALEIASAVKGGTVSAVEVARAALFRIEALDAHLGAFTAVTAERALDEAASVDARVRAGGDPGPLAGVPFAVKNLFDIKGLPTLAGSKINAGHPPAGADAELIRRLNDAGAVLVGALNMGEYAYDFTGENSHYGPSRNPHDPARMSGGSSGGSGTAVAAGFVPLALGSDTNGSIRVPSSFCGLFGLKPTFGRLSREGTFPFCSSLDHLGPLGRSAADLAAAYDAMQEPQTATPVSPVLGQGADGLRIAVAGDYFARGADPAAFEAVATVAEALGAGERVVVPEAARARAAAYVITTAEGGNLHLERLRNRAADFDPATRDRLLAGAMVPASWYLQAQRFRRWYHDRVMELFSRVDVILAPATPCTAPPIGQQTMVLDGVEMLVRPNIGIFTQPLSLIGLPVVAVPVPRPGGLPIGVQVVAAPGREDLAFRVAAELEARGICKAPVARGETSWER
ncbi:AtzE family amidohydrolase [Skermanella mucosa]|uniref:AtzE family amidohydrolase n=1 Tax=Skermanella mucosa TaxID=1789672 RepID=UPI00192AC5DA|nr:AtzE family amidohydrolase [Skermanella mucosa]UEM20255.1 AtzE family amidohydrolase [Skermanella mucosa]